MTVVTKAELRIIQWIWILLCSGVLLAACRGVSESRHATLTDPTITASLPERTAATSSPTPLRIIPSTTPKTTGSPVTPASHAPLTPTPQEKPTGTPSPTATRSPTVTPHIRILSFEATPQKIDPGDTVTLTWTTKGATRATLYRLLQSGQFPEHGMDVPPTGSITYTIDPQARNWVNFLLYVWGKGQASDNAGVSVILHCAHDWFFTPSPQENVCPTAPQTSPAAEQTFERGVMVWIEAENAIYVLYADEGYTTRWARFQDEWREGDPDRDPNLQAPTGIQQPIRGFGLVWRTYPSARERLGWAVEPEKGYQTTLQRTTRYKYNATYIRAEDGSVWYLGPERSSWDKIVTEQTYGSPRNESTALTVHP